MSTVRVIFVKLLLKHYVVTFGFDPGVVYNIEDHFVLGHFVNIACAQAGWVSRELLDAIGDYLDMPRMRVYEVATFYSMIELEPVGRHMVAVCKNIACMLCGADNIVTYIEDKLGIKGSSTTSLVFEDAHSVTSWTLTSPRWMSRRPRKTRRMSSVC